MRPDRFTRSDRSGREALGWLGLLVFSVIAHATGLAAFGSSPVRLTMQRANAERRVTDAELLAASEVSVEHEEGLAPPASQTARAESIDPSRISSIPGTETPSSRPGAEPILSGPGEGDGVNVTDIGGLLASLKRRLATPLAGGFAHVADRESPEASLRPPYPIVSDGRLDKETIRRAVRASSGRVRACYAATARRLGAQSWQLAITFTVGRSGEVISANEVGGDVPDTEARVCLVDVFRALRFPEPERGTATVTVPLRFAP